MALLVVLHSQLVWQVGGWNNGVSESREHRLIHGTAKHSAEFSQSSVFTGMSVDNDLRAAVLLQNACSHQSIHSAKESNLCSHQYIDGRKPVMGEDLSKVFLLYLCPGMIFNVAAPVNSTCLLCPCMAVCL